MFCANALCAARLFADAPAAASASDKYRVISEIVHVVIEAYRDGKSINLNRIKQDICARHHLPVQPTSVEIINAIPLEHRKQIMPHIKAKPVRTASGVRCVASHRSLLRYAPCMVFFPLGSFHARAY